MCFEKREAPKTLNECTNGSKIASRVAACGTIYMILCLIAIIILVFAAFIVGNSVSETQSSHYGDSTIAASTASYPLITIIIAIPSLALSAYVIPAIFKGFAQIIENSQVTANLAMYTAMKNEPDNTEKVFMNVMCITNDDPQDNSESSNSNTNNELTKCPKCGNSQPTNRKFCSYCGTKLN